MIFFSFVSGFPSATQTPKNMALLRIIINTCLILKSSYGSSPGAEDTGDSIRKTPPKSVRYQRLQSCLQAAHAHHKQGQQEQKSAIWRPPSSSAMLPSIRESRRCHGIL